MHAFTRAACGAWSKPLAWLISVAVVAALGALRAVTGAEFAFASLGLLSVPLMAWVAGRKAGVVNAALASATWIVGDIASGRDLTDWIPWANAVTWFVTCGIVVSLTDQARVQLSKVQELSIRDPLTGLLNRHALLDFGAREVDGSRRDAHSLVVVFIDLDNFKRLNDCEGHVRSGAALCATAVALRAFSRSTDTLARWGGDADVRATRCGRARGERRVG
ncbi:MAG: GGDEF domain-containing protein [Ramlibacter sp.]|nr:GGDEF domain-containing protein [Ramlibacter sp.]